MLVSFIVIILWENFLFFIFCLTFNKNKEKKTINENKHKSLWVSDLRMVTRVQFTHCRLQSGPYDQSEGREGVRVRDRWQLNIWWLDREPNRVEKQSQALSREFSDWTLKTSCWRMLEDDRTAVSSQLRRFLSLSLPISDLKFGKHIGL